MLMYIYMPVTRKMFVLYKVLFWRKGEEGEHIFKSIEEGREGMKSQRDFF